MRENYLYADADADAIILKRNSCHGNGGQHEDYRECQMSVARVPLPTIVVVDSEKSAEDQLRTMVTLYRCSDPHEVCFRSDNNYQLIINTMVVRHSPPRLSPPLTFTTPDIHHKAVDQTIE